MGVGANAAVFDTLDRLLYRPMHVPQANQMVTLNNLNRKTGRYQSATFLDYLDFARARSVSGLTAYLRLQSSLTIDGTKRKAWTDVVTDNFFDVLRVPPATGNVFSSRARPATWPMVAVVSDRDAMMTKSFDAKTGMDDNAIAAAAWAEMPNHTWTR